MAKTYLDQLVDYPAVIMQKISEDKHCVGFLLNKKFEEVTEDDFERALEKNIFDYQYVDDTTETVNAYIWVEAEVSRVENRQIKDMRLYITISCHKDYMLLNHKNYKGVMGNRRDNITRYVDKLLNGCSIVGIGGFKLKSVRTTAPAKNFTGRVLCYDVADFNVVEVNHEDFL